MLIDVFSALLGYQISRGELKIWKQEEAPELDDECLESNILLQFTYFSCFPLSYICSS
jgi:hypothetical protein